MRWLLVLLCVVPIGAGDRRDVCCALSDVEALMRARGSAIERKFATVLLETTYLAGVFPHRAQMDRIDAPVLFADLCDPRDRGTTQDWIGLHDCDPDRELEIWVGDHALAGGYGLLGKDYVLGQAGNTRSIETDLALFQFISTLAKSLLDAPNAVSSSAFIIGSAEVTVFYPPFGSGYLGYYLSPDFDCRGHPTCKGVSPAENPARQPTWTVPYGDEMSDHSIVSATVPLYFTGLVSVRSGAAHFYNDTWLGTVGQDVYLSSIEEQVPNKGDIEKRRAHPASR